MKKLILVALLVLLSALGPSEGKDGQKAFLIQEEVVPTGIPSEQPCCCSAQVASSESYRRSKCGSYDCSVSSCAGDLRTCGDQTKSCPPRHCISPSATTSPTPLAPR